MQGGHLDLVEVAFLVNDRPPGARGPFPVDAFDEVVDLVVELLVGADVSAAGYASLGIDQSAAVFGMGIEKAIESAKALGNSLGVVDSLDAECKHLVLEFE